MDNLGGETDGAYETAEERIGRVVDEVCAVLTLSPLTRVMMLDFVDMQRDFIEAAAAGEARFLIGLPEFEAVINSTLGWGGMLVALDRVKARVEAIPVKTVSE